MRNSTLKRTLLSVWFKIYDAQKLHKIRKKYKLSVLTSEKTIAYIKKHKCSIARYGDGEFAIMLQDGEPRFQKSSDTLSAALQKVFQNTSEKLLICVPRFLVSTKSMNQHGNRFWTGWAIAHQKAVVQAIRQLGGASYCFGDSYVSRPFTAYRSSKNAANIFSLLKDLWNECDILIVEGTLTRLGVGNDLFSNSKSIKRILAPAENAFDLYNEILKTVLSCWNGELVILALGPTATVLASDLSLYNIQALDLGHIDIQYEWYLKGDNSFQPVLGKYTNEAIGGKNVSPCKDADYLSQIITTIQQKADEL